MSHINIGKSVDLESDRKETMSDVSQRCSPKQLVGHLFFARTTGFAAGVVTGKNSHGYKAYKVAESTPIAVSPWLVASYKRLTHPSMTDDLANLANASHDQLAFKSGPDELTNAQCCQTICLIPGVMLPTWLGV